MALDFFEPLLDVVMSIPALDIVAQEDAVSVSVDLLRNALDAPEPATDRFPDVHLILFVL